MFRKINENDRVESKILLPDCSKLAINWKNDNYVTIANMTSSSNFFEVAMFVNIITGSGVMTVFAFKELTRKPEIGNTHHLRLG